MRYYVTVEGRTFEVDLTGTVPTVDGDPVEAELTRVPGTPTRHLLVDGRSYVFVAKRGAGDAWDIHLDGERFEVDVVDERTRAIRAMTGQESADRGPRPIRAPMPGLVVSVAVAEGDPVEAGQSVAIVEAMKMENDLKAESEGVVRRVAVEAGEPVEKGAVLVELDAGAEAGDG
ncbi:MAG: biotin/lipoyl-binding protein [Gemmatimonadetes bacterium]|nr:biotin/lipoyl-binding protein [Gemmatimonadota bacterium]NIQ60037.1 biotin/lipoyl-binding protein [Gemmatimonadota bacterium]NIU80255.1 biotin/lipoyl-binding protein [Gammaproteobacteria bacterium]NIX48637.1 biotin/lipoyl-binding protein [Gemmatimonadota bacterium]NIY13077.1 biotin/lipoyl-binding protein [Gemmatimonadota bacterium]